MGLTAVQKNQTKASSDSNQTAVTPACKQATKIINQTNIPANQTSTIVEKKTEPVEELLFLLIKLKHLLPAVKQNYRL
jgi:hypothetical protein